MKTATTLEEAANVLVSVSGKELRAYSTWDFGRDQNDDGRSVVVRDEDARSVVKQVRQALGPGLVCFIGCTNSLAEWGPKGSEVVVAKGDDQFSILRIARSDAVNFGIYTEGIVKKLQQYDQMFGIDIYHAETDTIEFVLKKRPDDMVAFCRDLYEFCPDIVDQGAGSVEELQREIEKAGEVFLWWD